MRPPRGIQEEYSSVIQCHRELPSPPAIRLRSQDPRRHQCWCKITWKVDACALHGGVFIWMYHVENDSGNSKKAKMTRVKSGSESAEMWKSVRQMNLFRSNTYEYFLICSHFCERCHKHNGHRSFFHTISSLTCATLCAAQHNNVWAELPKQRVASHLKVLLFYLSLFLMLLGIQTAHFSKLHIDELQRSSFLPACNPSLTGIHLFTCSHVQPQSHHYVFTGNTLRHYLGSTYAPSLWTMFPLGTEMLLLFPPPTGGCGKVK